MASVNIDAGYTGLVSENIFKEIIAARPDLVRSVGGRMIPGAAVYPIGTVLAQYSSGPNAGLFAPWDGANSSATDGSAKAIGVLKLSADVQADGSQSEIAVIVGGAELYADLLVTYSGGVGAAGLSAAALAALNGQKFVWHGQNIVKF